MKTKRVMIASEEVEYDIIRSSRRTVALYIRPGGSLLIRAPWYVPAYVLLKFVESKAPWISRHRDKLKEIRPDQPSTMINAGDKIPFMGRELTVRAHENSRNGIYVIEDEIHVSVYGALTPENITAFIDNWYLKEARNYFAERTQELVRLHGNILPVPSSVSIRKMKRRWGTCRSNGAILFNRELIKKDKELIDSVIIHELCHLVHHNHGKEFYALLESIIPDYRQRRRNLRNL
ncbi:MAG: M48 family metallopeptidase [Bacteroidales bacterium]|nr:M48 family metallopeptidase [Bacteroidales bacterium]